MPAIGIRTHYEGPRYVPSSLNSRLASSASYLFTCGRLTLHRRVQPT